MKPVTLHQLQVFAVTARHRSFTRAAEELYLTQPTVSMQVKQLAKAIGLPLFEQVGKRLYLTPAGESLLQACEDIFERLNQFEMTIADLKGLKQGRLNLTVVTTAKYFAPRLLGPFCQRYPDIDVALKVTNRERVLSRLSRNEDDLYIVSQPPEDSDVQRHSFLDDGLVVLAPPNHPMVGQRGIPIKALSEEPFLMREQGSGTRRMVEAFFAQEEVQVPVRMELGSNEAIKQAVTAGLGLSILSHHTLSLERALGQLAILDVQGFPLLRHWYVVYPTGKQLSVVAQAFLDYLLSEGKQIAMRTSVELTQGQQNGAPDLEPLVMRNPPDPVRTSS